MLASSNAAALARMCLLKVEAAAMTMLTELGVFFFSSRRRHTRSLCDWSSDVCSSDLGAIRKRKIPVIRGRLERPLVGSEVEFTRDQRAGSLAAGSRTGRRVALEPAHVPQLYQFARRQPGGHAHQVIQVRRALRVSTGRMAQTHVPGRDRPAESRIRGLHEQQPERHKQPDRYRVADALLSGACWKENAGRI